MKCDVNNCDKEPPANTYPQTSITLWYDEEEYHYEHELCDSHYTEFKELVEGFTDE